MASYYLRLLNLRLFFYCLLVLISRGRYGTLSLASYAFQPLRHGQDVVLVDQEPPINPVTLLKHHIRLNNIQGNTHIFSYRTPNGVQSLTKSLFLQRCNAIWTVLGYPRTTGHSFRIGGTTELLVAGIPPDVVRTTGRWSSESFLRYWRSLEDIAPLHIRNLHTMKHRRRPL